MVKLYGVIISLLLFQNVFAQATVHILSPWRNDTCAWHRDSLRMGGNNYVGYYPGSGMYPEGNGWFYYNYPATNINFTIVTWCGPADWAGRLDYKVNFRLDSMLMQFPKNTKELWILIPDSLSKPVISDRAPVGTKFIYFLNPWSIGAPQVVLKGYGTPRMRMDTSISRCGWFKYAYLGPVDSARVKFVNSLDKTVYSSVGIGEGEFIDLTTAFKTSDTAWVFSMPYPNGIPSANTVYPGLSAPCERTLYLGTILRDMDSSHPDVNIGETRKGCGADKSYNAATPGMVRPQLDANGKPVIAAATPCEVTRFDWFTTQTITGQYTNATCHNLKLTKNEDGLFEYDTNYFFPADSFRYLDDARTIPNPRCGTDRDNNNNPHNYYFTVELTAQFEYRKGQTFYFRGDDDVWVFINNRLVVDLGGVHNPMEGAVNLDTLGLTVGNTYTFKGFFVERNCCGSNFRMVTSINLRTSSSLFTKASTVSSVKKKYDMFVKVSQNNLSCDPGTTVIDTEPAVVEYFIEGPPFPAATPVPLPAGVTSYGGITVVGNSTVIIDTTAISGLPPGNYQIRYYLSSDHSEGGTIPFTVTSLPPDHIDLLVDAVPLESKKEAVVDSIVIGILETSAEAYAVIRDANHSYLRHATDPVWTVRDTSLIRVVRSAVNSSRCNITKVKAGKTWLVVNHAPGLKPDSVLVITRENPPYPVVVAGVMGDIDADLVPDRLYLTLSDSLKADQQLDSVRIDYRGKPVVVSGAALSVKSKQVTLLLPATLTTDARPKGTATIFITVAGEVKNSSQLFTDGVSPAVVAADVLENDGNEGDVLFVTFSEPMVVTTVIGRQFLLIKPAVSDTIALTIARVFDQLNDSTFAVEVTPSEPAMKVSVGDKLRLVPGNAGGTLADISGNKAHDLNKSVTIGFKAGAASISEAKYFDRDADGIIDQLKVRFKRKVAPAEIDSVTIRRNATFISIPFSAGSSLNDSVYLVPVGEQMSRLPLSTGGTMNITVWYHAYPEIPRNSPVTDSAAPVLVAASLLPGSYTPSGGREADILTVSASEGAAQFGLSPFLLSAKSDGQRYSFTLTYLGENRPTQYSYRFTVLSTSPSTQFASSGDTIWIDPAANVCDSGLVAQNNPLNRRVLLKVEWPKAEWKVITSANPFNRTTPIQDALFGGGEGVAIVVTPTAPIDRARKKACVTIFDKVGNVVKSADLETFKTGYRFVWRGDNRKGRLVGTGTYLAVVRIDEGGNRELFKTLKLAVERE